jgi:hypothetical protein
VRGSLSLRRLNRATLARQLLLERRAAPAAAAVERLAGLQAQQARPPYVGLWTRLADFDRDELAGRIDERTVIKATWVRATLHLVTAADFLRLRSTLQPMLTAAWSSIAKRRGADFDLDEILAAGRSFLDEAPRTFAEVSAMLSERWPDFDVGAMRYAVRTHLPLVQVPADVAWSYPGKPAFTLAESWLGRPPGPADGLKELVKRYLAAFGPASVTDAQKWSGLAKLGGVFEELRPQLVTYRDGRRELFDLPGLEPPDEDVPAPVRFLPEYDNLLLAHAKRERVVADEHRSKVYLPGLRVAATFQVDGFVAGVWKTETSGKTATLVLEPFASLARRDRDALVEEGERLVRFAEPKARSFAVRVE